jgi:hypothetical protein
VANSTTMITDVTTVLTNGPNAATQALCNAASGVIMDYVGNVTEVLLELQQMSQRMNMIIADTDVSDAANLALLQKVANNLT